MSHSRTRRTAKFSSALSRRSLWTPSGYTFSEFHPIFSKHPLGYGTNDFDKIFPFGLGEFILQQLGGGLGHAFADKFDALIKDKNKFIRPHEQLKKIQGLNKDITDEEIVFGIYAPLIRDSSGYPLIDSDGNIFLDLAAQR